MQISSRFFFPYLIILRFKIELYSAKIGKKVENVEKNYPVLVYELPGTESTQATSQEQADEVSKMIDAIGTVTKDSEAAIKKARAAYDKLSSNDKLYVKNYDKLKKAEKKIKKLLEE